MIQTISLKKLRPQLPGLINAVSQRWDRFILTKRGEPKAILLSTEDYEGLLETLDILEDKAGMKRLKRAKSQLAKGQTRSLEDIRNSLKRGL